MSLRSGTVAPLLLLGGVALAWIACGDDKPAPEIVELPYDVLCPSPGGSCANADGALQVGVAVRDITPVVTETFCDCGNDGICPPSYIGCPSDGYTAPDPNEGNAEFNVHPTVVDGSEPVNDANGNGFFDAVWIAGFSNARPAQGVHDPIWARAVVLRKGETTLAIVAVDLIGYFYDEVQRIRSAIAAEAGVDLVLVGATHTHQGPDSIGIWGFNEGTSGVDPAFMATVRSAVVEAVQEAAAAAEPAVMDVAEVESGAYHPIQAVRTDRRFNNFIQDGHDPVVIDPMLRIMRFARVSDDSTIATLVNAANHPEAMCSDNTYISSDFVHYLRLALENGIDRGGVVEPGLGGTAVFVNGALGGMMSPLNILPVIDIDGTELGTRCVNPASPSDPFYQRARAFGEGAALDMLIGLRTVGERVVEPDISFATKVFRMPIENVGYHAMFVTGVFYGACEVSIGGITRPRRCMYDFDEKAQITNSNLPHVETEVAVVNIGPLQALAVPGELFPEWFLGGYDGSFSGPMQRVIDDVANIIPDNPRSCTSAAECVGAPLDSGNACEAGRCLCTNGICLHKDYNPPDLAAAPAGPYLREKMTRRIRTVFGLTPDELGYIVPLYDYKLHDRLPFVEEAPGHYEETNSIGPGIGAEVKQRLETLLTLVP